MSIREIEDLIIKKIKESFPSFLVQGFPEKPQEFILLHPIGAILVHYRGGSYSSTDTLNFISQDKRMEFAVTVVTRNLRSNDGAYEVLEGVKQCLCGYKIIGCSKLTPIKEGFLSEIKGIWQYELSFSLSAPSLEILEEGD